MRGGFIKRAAANVGASLLWAYTIVDFVFDWIGRSTVDDDAKQLVNEKLPAWATWLFSTPSWVPALCALILTGWLVWLSRSPSPPQNNPTQRQEGAAAGASAAIDPARDERLLMRKENQRLALENDRLRLQQSAAPSEIQGRSQKRAVLDEISVIQIRQFVQGPLTELHNGLVEVFFASYNPLRPEWQSNTLLRLSHDLFERCVRDEFERVLEFTKSDDIDEVEARSVLMRYAQRFGESTEIMNVVAENFNLPNSGNPNLPIWQRGRDAVAPEARKTSVFPRLGFMTEIGERLRQEADKLRR